MAERVFSGDPTTSLIKSRQVCEYRGKKVAALSGVYETERGNTTNDLIRQMTAQQVLPREVADILRAMRRSGNEASRGFGGSVARAPPPLSFVEHSACHRYNAARLGNKCAAVLDALLAES